METPLLHQVILLIDLCTMLLEQAIADVVNHQVVRVAAVCGLQMVNKYYSRMDDSVMYHIAMSICFVFSLTPNLNSNICAVACSNVPTV